jgi:hypothetical protein
MPNSSPPNPSRVAELLESIADRPVVADNHTPLPPAIRDLDLAPPAITPFAVLLDDLRARLLAYARGGWDVEVNGLPCRANDGRPTSRDGYWRRDTDRSLSVTITLRPMR